jgi:type IV pilus assembly protein PilZ
MTIERRRFQRFGLKGEVEVHFANWTMFKVFWTSNISKGGMALDVPDPTPVGTKLRVRLILPTGWMVAIDAVVRHTSVVAAPKATGDSEPFCHIGVEFLNLDDQKRAMIEQTIREHGQPF